jgi:hypothetical protein
MYKWLAILTFLIGAGPQVPRDGNRENQKSQTAASQPDTAQPAPPRTEIRASTPEEQQPANPKPSKYPWHELFAPANIPNWVLVLVGGGGVWAALRTLRAIEGQLRLQEVQYRQWAEIGGWKNLSKGIRMDATEAEMILGFEVENKTGFPFTLRRLETGIEGEGSSSTTMERMIAPGGSYAAIYPFEATSEQLRLYWLNKLIVTLSIVVGIRDVLGKERSAQQFTQIITFGPTKCESIGQPPHVVLRIKQIR